MSFGTTHGLLASTDIAGTPVYSDNGEQVGTVDHIVFDPVKGRLAYAVMAFGGFLGLGEHTYSIPWASVRFDTERRAFVTGISKEQIESAPERPDDWHLDRRWEERTFDHYRVPPYWL